MNTCSLPSSEETGLPDHAVCTANHCYPCCTKDPSGDRKRKNTMSFTAGLCQAWQVHCAKRNSNGWKALQ